MIRNSTDFSKTGIKQARGLINLSTSFLVLKRRPSIGIPRSRMANQNHY